MKYRFQNNMTKKPVSVYAERRLSLPTIQSYVCIIMALFSGHDSCPVIVYRQTINNQCLFHSTCSVWYKNHGSYYTVVGANCPYCPRLKNPWGETASVGCTRCSGSSGRVNGADLVDVKAIARPEDRLND